MKPKSRTLAVRPQHAAALLAITLAVTLLWGCCRPCAGAAYGSPATADTTTHTIATHRDLLRDISLRVDSIHIRDSVITLIRGDTVLTDRWHTEFRDRLRTDTLVRLRTQTLWRTRTVTLRIRTPTPPTTWQRLTQTAGTLAILAAAAVIIISLARRYIRRHA